MNIGTSAFFDSDHIENVYYEGDESDWDNIQHDSGSVEAVYAYTTDTEDKIQTSGGTKLDIVDGERATFDAGSIVDFKIADNVLKFVANATYFVKDDKEGYVWSRYDEDSNQSSIYVSLYTGTGYTEPIVAYNKSGVRWNTLSTLIDAAGNWVFLVNETDRCRFSSG